MPVNEAEEQLRALADRRLSDAEWRAYVDAPISEREREEILSLVDWFRSRYPTPAERVRYARRALRNARSRIPALR
jgi:hypothetical protein